MEDIPAYVQANPVHLVIVAIPSANNVQMKRIYNTLKNLNVTVKTLPSLVEIMGESSTLTQLRDITVSDLLGREEVQSIRSRFRILSRTKWLSSQARGEASGRNFVARSSNGGRRASS